MRSDLVKRSIVGTYSALADASVGNIAINVPVDVNTGRGIQIWGLSIEFSDGTWFTTDNKEISFILSRVQVTAAKYANDPDVILKIKKHSELTTSGAVLNDQVINVDLYPAVPFMGSQIHLGIVNATGASQTVYVKIWYSVIQLEQYEMLGMLQNQAF